MRKSIYTYAMWLVLPLIALMTSCEPYAIPENTIFFPSDTTTEGEANLHKWLDENNPEGWKIFTLDDFVDTFMTEEGNFLSLDHTKVYSLWVGNETLGYKNKYSFTFDDIYQDIHLVIDNKTAVEEINANKAVAGVKYYNVAGQAADKAFDGVNVVVTTYVDGTQSVVKVVK